MRRFLEALTIIALVGLVIHGDLSLTVLFGVIAAFSTGVLILVRQMEYHMGGAFFKSKAEYEAEAERDQGGQGCPE